MRRVGIITIPDYENYGNRLQNYAVVKFFESKGFLVDTLELNDKEFPKYKERKIKLLIKKYKLNFIVAFYNKLKRGKRYSNHYKLFEKFSKQNLNIKYYPSYNKKIIKKLNKRYDFFVLGSDQIWNPKINDTPNIYFCTFADCWKKIPFAASFGVSKMTRSDKDDYSKYLKSFAFISVRESEGKKLVEELTDVPCDVLCDPTLLIDSEMWEKLIETPKKIAKNIKTNRFVFSFFLGPKNSEYEKYIKDNFGDELVVEINERKDNIEFESCGPQEFLWYIKNASVILTDSFHATVFSIIFNKQFIVFSRLNKEKMNDGMDSRINSLLSMFNLENNKFNAEHVYQTDLHICDNSLKISKEKQNAHKYIDNILKRGR